jgi:3'-5' exoribonuclease
LKIKRQKAKILKKIFVKGIRADSNVCDCFLVKQKELCKSKSDKSYLSIKLCDKTGAIEARVWNNADRLNTLFDKGDVILVKKGTASLYQNRVQISIADLEKVNKTDADMSDFLESSAFSIDEMLNRLKEYSDKVKNAHLRKLLGMFFKDSDFMDGFCSAPAAKTVHHAYLGGLLEHTLSVTSLVMLITKNYPELNEDVLITGAILHDIGKIKELSTSVGFEYTNDGRLLGHIVMGTIMLEKKIEQIKDFPVRLSSLLKHMILSHHGIYEWGSPKKPKTLEALVLHYADDIDAKIVMVKNALKRDVGSKDAGWTGYHSLLERYLFKEADDYGKGSDIKELPQEEKSKEQKTAGSTQFNMFEDKS